MSLNVKVYLIVINHYLKATSCGAIDSLLLAIEYLVTILLFNTFN